MRPLRIISVPRFVALAALFALGSLGCNNAAQPPIGSGGTTGTGGARIADRGTGGAGAGGAGIGGAGAGGAAGPIDAGDAAADRAGGSGGARDGATQPDGARTDGGGVGGAAGATDAGDAAADRAGGSGGARDGATQSDGARTDGGGDAGTAFHPCPTGGAACIVMPLGDSITEGYPKLNGGYRVELFNQAVMAAKNITFVGRRPNGPDTVDGKPFPKGNEGYSGYTIDDGAGRTGISGLVDAAITMFRPHIILLMIGTNDVNLSNDLANAPTRLGNLLDRITTAAPSALLVVAQITPTTTDATNARVMTYNAAIPGLVQQRIAAGKHLALVDMYAAITSRSDYKTAYMVDDLHPNDAGYVKLGQTWYAAISGVLP